MSAALDDEDPSIVEVVEKLTREGNILYKSGKLTQAAQKYHDAMQADDDAGPCTVRASRNLTAVYFEMGQYSACRSMTEEILEFIQPHFPEDKANLAKLEHRLQRAIAHIPQASEKEKLQRLLKIFASVPHNRASMHTHKVYFPVGNDHAASLFHNLLFERFHRDKRRPISFFLGGVGDARHLYATLIDLHQSENDGASPGRKYHFVANDVNRCALTRDLIIWTLLEELSTLEQDSDHRLMALATIFFIYESNIMPNYIHDNLRAIMEKILVSLNKGNSPLEWVSIHEYDTPKYIEVLKHWLGEGDEIFTTSEAMRATQDAFLRQVPSPTQNCQKEQQLYAKYGLLYPPERILLSREPELSNLLKNKFKPNKLREYVERNWRFNPTMMDLDWYKDMQRMDSFGEFDMNTNPFDAVKHFYHYHEGQNPTSLFDHVAPLFDRAADALKMMKRRLHVEPICGDVIEVAEWFCFGISPTRVPRLKKFPTQFDAIHLSNIPDYIGGHLATFLYLTPMMKFEPSSTLKSNCVRNTGCWDSTEAFLADYQCITDKEMLKKLTGVGVINEPGKGEHNPLAQYNWYTPALPVFKGDWSNLFPRIDFQKWFHALFFRLALPYNVDIFTIHTMIFSPLNLTILFRLMNQLRALHYPSHWMSEILLDIIENKVVSSCRPPRMTPTTVSELKRQYEARRLCTIPFSHEMATLTRIFMPVLPFTLTSSTIPAQSDIYRYTFPLPTFASYREVPLNLTLIFWCGKYLTCLGDVGDESLIHNIRPLLDPTWGDEMDSQFKGVHFDALRENGLIVWSTIEWDTETLEASAWVPSSLMDKMISEGDEDEDSAWYYGLFRTDTWERCWKIPGNVNHAEKAGRWEDDVLSAADGQLVDLAGAALSLVKQESI